MNTITFLLKKAGLVISREKTIRPLIKENMHDVIWHDKLQPLFTVDNRILRDFFAQDYAPNGINPFIETIQQYITSGEKLKYSESSLYNYYCNFQPSTPLDVFFSSRDKEGRRHITSVGGLKEFILPWDYRTKTDPSGMLQYSGPMSQERGEYEFNRLIDVYISIKKKGYTPNKSCNLFNSNHIQGYFLKYGEDYRFVILHGKHRAAALAALGKMEVPVTFELGRPRAVSLDQISEWPQVYNGTYGISLARDIFECFFFL